jgi:hypothetical protein
LQVEYQRLETHHRGRGQSGLPHPGDLAAT